MGKFLMALKSLEQWFNLQKRALPWRESPTLYRVWVSEVMLQQTQVVTVIPFFERWMARFPTVQHLAQAPEEEVLGLWAGLGYYSRARNLHRGAQIIVEQRRFPESRAEWLEIPGVGNYTAGAILSIAGNQPEAILDGNVERVLSRVRRVTRQKGDTEFRSRLWRLSQQFVETAHRIGIEPSHLNQSLMELGATLCTPKKPDCSICPVVFLCRAYERGDVESFPPKKKPRAWVHLEETLHALVNERGQVLLSQNSGGRWRAGLWDFLAQDPTTFFEGLISVGQIETRYVVTRHKVRRITRVWQVPKPTQRKPWRVSASAAGAEQWTWIASMSECPPLGAPAKKVLAQVFARNQIKG